jgi:hypothetical protein
VVDRVAGVRVAQRVAVRDRNENGLPVQLGKPSMTNRGVSRGHT